MVLGCCDVVVLRAVGAVVLLYCGSVLLFYCGSVVLWFCCCGLGEYAYFPPREPLGPRVYSFVPTTYKEI